MTTREGRPETPCQAHGATEAVKIGPRAAEGAGIGVTGLAPERGVEEYLALRYADDPIEAFNLFIKAWVPEEFHAHLLDDDENDGRFVREHIVLHRHDTLRELADRLENAAGTLQAMALAKDELGHTGDYDRLRGKAEGVKLALSFVRELMA